MVFEIQVILVRDAGEAGRAGGSDDRESNGGLGWLPKSSMNLAEARAAKTKLEHGPGSCRAG